MYRKSRPGACLCFVVLSIGWLFAQVEGSRPPSTEGGPNSARVPVVATASKGQIRFVSVGLIRRMRLEVVDQAETPLYDSDFSDGSVMDWKMEYQNGRRLPDGLYGCLIAVEDLAGHRSYRRIPLWVRSC